MNDQEEKLHFFGLNNGDEGKWTACQECIWICHAWYTLNNRYLTLMFNLYFFLKIMDSSTVCLLTEPKAVFSKSIQLPGS